MQETQRDELGEKIREYLDGRRGDLLFRSAVRFAGYIPEQPAKRDYRENRQQNK